MTVRSRDGGGNLPYTGSLGATRHEAVFVTGSDGAARRIDVVRSINAATDPALARAALEGALNRLEDGTELAAPFIFHDPAARRFVLVVPRTRAHEELLLQADLLMRLAADTSAPIPAYVREARTVVGTEGLRRALEDAEVSVEETRHDAVTAREERLRERAEDVTRREDELRAQTEEIEIERADLALREQQIEQRLRELAAREEALASDEKAMRANMAALQARERKLEARAEALEARERELEARERELEARERELQAREGVGLVVQALEPEPAAGRRDSAPEIDPIDAEPLDAEEAVDEPAARSISLEPMTEESSTHDALDAEEIVPDEIEPLQPTPAAEIPAAWALRGQGAYAAVIEGEVRLWAHGRAEGLSGLGGGARLLLQADPDATLPLALLSVLGEEGPVARVVLDHTRPDDRAVLESLARDFRVRLDVVSHAGRSLGNYPVGAPGEANAQRVLAVLAAREPGTEEARRAEAERLVAQGVRSPEGREFDRTFGDDSLLATAAGAEAAARAYEPLLDPALYERLVIAHGVEPSRIDSLGKRVVLAALRCGVRLPQRLIEHAVRTGVAPDERALAARALAAYARTCESGVEAIGRTRVEALRAWEPLMAWAEQVGASVPDAARGVMRALFDPDDPACEPPPDPRPAPGPDAIAAMTDEDLERWVDHPAARELIAREMTRRDASRFAPALSRALRLLPEERAADLAAEMIRASDALGDVWVELLSSRRPQVPPIAAVATAAIHLRRGLGPVLQRALVRENTDWKLYAWAAGEFGMTVIKALTRVEEPETERVAWILAHAIRAGAGRDVEKVRTVQPGAFADAAARAIGLVDEARAYDAMLRQGPGESPAEQAAHRVLAHIAARQGESAPALPPEGV